MYYESYYSFMLPRNFENCRVKSTEPVIIFWETLVLLIGYRIGFNCDSGAQNTPLTPSS